MSWWDAKGFSSLASQALKTAQKKIDKVLDIDESTEGGKAKASGDAAKSTKSPAATATAPADSTADSNEGNSWNSWGSWIGTKAASTDSTEQADPGASQSAGSMYSWNFWGSEGNTSSSSPASSPDAASRFPAQKPKPLPKGKASLPSSSGPNSKLSEQKREAEPATSSPKEAVLKLTEGSDKGITTSRVTEDFVLPPSGAEAAPTLSQDSGEVEPEDSRTSSPHLEKVVTVQSSVTESEEVMRSDSQSEAVGMAESQSSEVASRLTDSSDGWQISQLSVSGISDVCEDHFSRPESVPPQQDISESVARTRPDVSPSGNARKEDWDPGVLNLPSQPSDVLSAALEAQSRASDVSFQASEGPSQGSVDPFQASDFPCLASDVLSTATDVPNQESDVPSEGSVVPCQPSEVSSQALDTPSQASDILSQTSDIPFQATDIPYQVSDIPSQASDIPSEALDFSSQASDIPSQALETPSQASDIPSQASDTPSQALDIPALSSDVPCQASGRALKASSSADTMESGETGISASSSDTMIAGEGSFTQVCAGEDPQATSQTSSSSDAVLLSLSSEDKLPDAFRPCRNSSPTGDKEGAPSSREERPASVGSPALDSTASNESSETSRFNSSGDTVIDQQAEEAQSGEPGWAGESGLLELGAAHSPSASFVKCMIEDAMGSEDPCKQEDSGSDNHSEEKSDGSKVDSEFEKSIYSGHESSDEIETTTSSDIEIISTPTPNGDRDIVDLSPLKFSLQKATRRSHGQGHCRSDSQSSSSTHSKGDADHLSPERDSDLERPEGKRSRQPHRDCGGGAQDEESENPQHPQRLLKNTINQKEKDVAKKLAEMAEVLQARENRLVQLSKDNNDLLETNSILRSQLQQAEEARETEMTDIHAVTEEFSRRMGESERKVQAVLKEKESLKQQLQLAQSELAKRSEDTNLQAVLEEKDEQIQGLMEEGEKLSKQQLQNSTIIKKLRTKEKENEGLLASQKKKLDQQKEELSKLKTVLDSKEDMEKKQADAIKQLNAAIQMMEKEKSKLQVEVESAEEKIRGLQSTLDNSYKEIAELHKSNASQDSRAQQAALSAEMQVREEVKLAMEQQAQLHHRQTEALITQIEDLRLSLSRMEKENHRREELYKQENADLQMRLQEDESRTQDLTHSITTATRPLLRQIENLQTTHSIQSSAWEKVERSLTERLSEAQTLLAVAQEKERSAVEKVREMSGRCTALEAANSLLRQEKSQLAAQQHNDKRRLDLLEERKASETAQLDLAKQKLSEEVAAIRKDKVFLESQLEVERNRLEAERQRVAVAEEQIRILERERPRSRGTRSPSPVSVSRQESMNSSYSERSSTPTWLLTKPEEGDAHSLTPTGSKPSLYESLRHTGAASLIENLQSQLKLREGEITQLQADIQQLERTRESMARELVSLSNLNDELQEEVKELPTVRASLKELDSRYNALLQMYGEKEEKVQELMLDLADVKEMYKQQINSLMK